MKRKLFGFVLALTMAFVLSISASAEIGLRPVANPWDDPENLEKDGQTYYAYNEQGYIIAWETPECDVDGDYVLLKNKTELVVEYRITYMDNVPWGHVTVEVQRDGAEPETFAGWVLMSDLLDVNGEPAAVLPPQVPEHPMITNPPVVPTPEPTDAPPTPSPTLALPQRPQQAITISSTYNTAIVYTSVGIAVVAVCLVIYIILKHKALNKKGE